MRAAQALRRAVLAGACLAVVATTAGCESTQSKSARLESESGKNLATERTGLKVAKLADGVKVGETAVITDVNGTAVVVTLRNDNKEALAQVPLALEVVDAKGKSVYDNSAPGLGTSLISAALLPAGKDQIWIHDQVVPVGKPDDAKARAGTGGEEIKGELPRIDVPDPKLETDPTSGLAAVGKVVNKSDTEQKDLVVNVVAREGGKIVAAGRAIVRRLKANKDATYQAFLIGKAEGAQLEASAPPTTLK